MRLFLILFLLFFGMSINIRAEGTAVVDSLEDATALSESTGMPALIIFGADWCGFCNLLKKDIENGSLNKELRNYIVCYIDIDKNKHLKKEFGVKTLPDSRIFIQNKEIDQHKGYEKNKYKNWINNVSK